VPQVKRLTMVCGCRSMLHASQNTTGMRMVQNVVDHCIMNVAVCTRPCLSSRTCFSSSLGRVREERRWMGTCGALISTQPGWCWRSGRAHCSLPPAASMQARNSSAGTALCGRVSVRGPQSQSRRQTPQRPQTGSALPSSGHLVRAEQAAMADVVLMW
jgi:hypothetical protein